MIFRPSMLRDLKKAQCLDGASLISSIWSGYVHRSHDELDQMEALGIARTHVHTSGHATVDELKALCESAFPAITDRSDPFGRSGRVFGVVAEC